MLDGFCPDASCALEVGGDNYTLDYGRPTGFVALDAYLWRHGVPVVLWRVRGALRGRSRLRPEDLRPSLRDAGNFSFARPESYEYLQQHGINAKLHRMSDPAFVMDPVEPPPDKIVICPRTRLV